jgi:hypothetical protein
VAGSSRHWRAPEASEAREASCAAGERRNQSPLREEEIPNQLQPLPDVLSFASEAADRNHSELQQALFASGLEEGNRNQLDLLSVSEVATWI